VKRPKPGDLVKHTRSGYVAIVLRLPRGTPDLGMVSVLTVEGPGKWSYSKCEVISEGR
jgi:hypothetical protein